MISCIDTLRKTCTNDTIVEADCKWIRIYWCWNKEVRLPSSTGDTFEGKLQARTGSSQVVLGTSRVELKFRPVKTSRAESTPGVTGRVSHASCLLDLWGQPSLIIHVFMHQKRLLTHKTVLPCLTECRCRVRSTPASYSRGPGFLSLSADWISSLNFNVAFLSTSRQRSKKHLKLNSDRVLPYIFKFINYSLTTLYFATMGL
jgi:hypothetical protein